LQITINAAYFAKDANGDKIDPFCGNNDGVNVFAQFLPTLAVRPPNYAESYAQTSHTAHTLN
jgi:hypothetical protein